MFRLEELVHELVRLFLRAIPDGFEIVHPVVGHLVMHIVFLFAEIVERQYELRDNFVHIDRDPQTSTARRGCLHKRRLIAWIYGCRLGGRGRRNIRAGRPRAHTLDRLPYRGPSLPG
eukprot:6527421-Pyramimonas_sp.AAC.1